MFTIFDIWEFQGMGAIISIITNYRIGVRN